MSDEDELSEPTLSPKQQRFVDEYLVDRNAAAAAQRAGYSPRSAASLMSNEHISLEIARRLAAIAADTNVSVKSLIAEVEAAREVAEAAGNASAMVAAIKLKADLTGNLDAREAPKSDRSDRPTDIASTAAAIVEIFREYASQTGYVVTVTKSGEPIDDSASESSGSSVAENSDVSGTP
jgi:phage terminase small subunit